MLRVASRPELRPYGKYQGPGGEGRPVPAGARVISALLFGLSAIALGHALQLNNGFYDYSSLKWVTGALLLCGAGVACLRIRSLAARRLAPGGLRCPWPPASRGNCVSLLRATPGFYLDADPDYRLLEALARRRGGDDRLGAGGMRRAARLWFPAVLALNVALGVWIIKASPDPTNRRGHGASSGDRGADEAPGSRIAFRSRTSTARMPRTSTTRRRSPADRIAFGYPYPPVSLLFAVPGQVLLGDFRYA